MVGNTLYGLRRGTMIDLSNIGKFYEAMNLQGKVNACYREAAQLAKELELLVHQNNRSHELNRLKSSKTEKSLL